MTLHRKKPKMAMAAWRVELYGLRTDDRLWFACYRWHKAVKP